VSKTELKRMAGCQGELVILGSVALFVYHSCEDEKRCTGSYYECHVPRALRYATIRWLAYQKLIYR
jgi:hypothetical protein